MRNRTPRIIVIGPGWIGDMVMAQCLFKALKRQSPDCTLDVLGPAWAPALLERMPEVDNIIDADIAHGELALGKRWRIAKALRINRYDQAFVTSRSMKSALIPWFARVRRRTGYRGEARYGIVNDMRELDTRLTKIAQRYVALSLAPEQHSSAARNIEFPQLSVSKDNRDRLLAQHGLTLQRPVVAFVPGAAYGETKRWPPGYYASLARELTRRGMQCWLFGGEGDVAIGREIAAAVPEHCVDLCAKTNLADVVDLMSLAQTAVCNDTGLTHIAAAVGANVVALYGSTPPEYTPPLCHNAVVLWLNLDCSPCNERVCPLGHTLCLRALPVADVVRACVAPDDTSIPSRYTPSHA